MNVRVICPPGQRPRASTEELAELLRAAGGKGDGGAVLAAWQGRWPAVQATHAHGERHDLWWEFRLADSFAWQCRAGRLTGEYWRQRLERLVGALGLAPLLNAAAEEMTPAQRSLAALAQALLPAPDLLVWEEPFLHLAGPERKAAVGLVRRLCRSEGLTLVAAAVQPPGLAGLDEEGRSYGRGDAGRTGHPGRGGRAGSSGRLALAQ